MSPERKIMEELEKVTPEEAKCRNYAGMADNITEGKQ